MGNSTLSALKVFPLRVFSVTQTRQCERKLRWSCLCCVCSPVSLVLKNICLKTFQQFKVSYKRKIPQALWGSFWGSFWERFNFLTGRKRLQVERGRMTWLLFIKEQMQCGTWTPHAMGVGVWQGKPNLTSQVSLQLWQTLGWEAPVWGTVWY